MEVILSEKEKQYLLSTIRDIKGFPKPGIIFKDITTLLNDAKAFNFLMEHLEQRYKSYNLDFVAGIDSRGFIFGAALADRLKIGFVPVRKKGKLPSTTICEKYELEYGFDEVEIHIDAFCSIKNPRVLLIDDLLATGGTAKAASTIIKKTNANLVEMCFLIHLKEFGGLKKVQKNAPVYNILEV